MAEPKTFVLLRAAEEQLFSSSAVPPPNCYSQKLNGVLIHLPIKLDATEVGLVVTPRLSVRERRADVIRQWTCGAANAAQLEHVLDTLEAIDRGDP